MKTVKRPWVFRYPYLTSIGVVFLLIISPFILYHYEQKIEILSVYSHLKQEPKSQNRILPMKKDQEYIRILSISGGGVRGIIPVHVLKYLEEQSRKPVCELFDVIIGTSTGAVASTGLTVPGPDLRPRYSASQVLDLYNTEGKKIFYNPWYHKLLTINGLIGPKYMTASRYKVLKKYIGDAYLDQLLNNVVVPTYNVNTESPMLFLNWEGGNAEVANFAVMDILMSAISPPGLFPSVVFGPKGEHFVLADGAVYANNPDLMAALIAMSIYPDKKYILVSLGTGYTYESLAEKDPENWGFFQWSQKAEPLFVGSGTKFNEYMLREFFPFHLNIYRFDTELKKSSFLLDDVSNHNILRLNRAGEDLVKNQKKELDELIPRLLRP